MVNSENRITTDETIANRMAHTGRKIKLNMKRIRILGKLFYDYFLLPVILFRIFIRESFFLFAIHSNNVIKNGYFLLVDRHTSTPFAQTINLEMPGYG